MKVKSGIVKKDEDEAYVTRALNLMGVVGVPSMQARADPLERPLDVPLNTPILQAPRRGAKLILRGIVGEIEEDFQDFVIAIPTPFAMPLVREPSDLPDALRAVRHRSRRLLLGSERKRCISPRSSSYWRRKIVADFCPGGASPDG